MKNRVNIHIIGIPLEPLFGFFFFEYLIFYKLKEIQIKGIGRIPWSQQRAEVSVNR